jgi:hypothetical protein
MALSDAVWLRVSAFLFLARRWENHARAEGGRQYSEKSAEDGPDKHGDAGPQEDALHSTSDDQAECDAVRAGQRRPQQGAEKEPAGRAAE